ncbi:MAG: thiol:disulfide interchange protein DsbA/DsbL [Betaproteobacteria bacterium]|nr:thiol:disulfide interchange protein DsbA/DsbL [Betaproteobacteria bacterium]
MKRLFAFLIAALVVAPAMVASQPRGAYTELKPPQQTPAGGKIDVIEFFWYGCIHCYNLEPALEGWLKKLPPDAQFRRVPAVFNARWEHDARIFYAFEALGLTDKLHRPFFDAIHRDRLRTDDPKALAQWLQNQGVDAQKFTDVMKSFSVHSKTQRAKLMTAGYRIDGTPAMAVDGRYTVSAGESMLQTVSQLIDQARKQR